MKINPLTPFCVDQRNSEVSSYRDSLVFVAGARSIDVVLLCIVRLQTQVFTHLFQVLM